MKGDRTIIQHLNKVLTNELTAINQYFLHARMYQHWGYERLGRKVYQESVEEMRHADILIKRVLFLDGLPNLQDLHRLMVGENVPESLGADLEVERRGRVTLVEAIAACEAAQDYVSRDLITPILVDTEEHIDWLETQLGLIEAIGLQNYLQSQAEPAS
ncbi:bacterioferritin [Zavarzinia sp. CC-PAN008]|uniref:bacterioferritin n=1 Tax=Zavarzinia sp. CC-PAN008 TaxID=3243332 RepID=UPI003F7465E7